MEDNDTRKKMRRYFCLQAIKTLLSFGFNGFHTLREVFKLVESQRLFQHIEQSDESEALASEIEQELKGIFPKNKVADAVSPKIT